MRIALGVQRANELFESECGAEVLYFIKVVLPPCGKP